MQMRIHRCAHVVRPRLHRRDEPHQRASVVALRKTLAVHQVSTTQLGVGVEEPVGGDQVDARVVIPAGQQCLQHTGRGRLTDRHAAGDADDERHRPVGILLRLAEELGGRREQPLAGRDLQMDEPRQRQVDLFDLEQVDLLAEAAQADDFLFGQLRRRHPERAPLTSVELHIGARLAGPRHASVLQPGVRHGQAGASGR